MIQEEAGMKGYIEECTIQSKFFTKIENKLRCFLQPNIRRRLQANFGNNKVKKSKEYLQEEIEFSGFLNKIGSRLHGYYGQALKAIAESYEEIGNIKLNREHDLRSKFLLPICENEQKELKSIFQKVKIYNTKANDCLSKKKAVDKGEIGAEANFNRVTIELSQVKNDLTTSLQLYSSSEPERISALMQLIETEINYHRSAAETLENKLIMITNLRENAFKNPWNSSSDQVSTGNEQYSNKGDVLSQEAIYPEQIYESSPPIGICKVIYDFDADGPEELTLKEGDVVKIIKQIDEEWLYGEINGKCGDFPSTFVEMLPHNMI